MKKSIKRLAVILITAALMITVACSNATKPAGGFKDIKSDTARYNAAGTFPIAKQKTALTIGVPQSSFVKDYKTNELTKEIEKKGNVDLQFTVFPSGQDYNNKIQLMISSDSTLPDVLVGPQLIADDYVKSGVLLATNGYYKNTDIAYYFNKKFENDQKTKEMVLKYSTSYTGNINGMVSYCPEIGNETPYRIWINQAWLKTLGLNMPKTTDDFYNTLKAFVTQDPNKNGKNDEIGFIGSADGYGANIMVALMNAFIYANPSNSYCLLNNGKLDVAYNKPEWLEGLKFMNKLVKEGLLSQLSFTQKGVQLNAILQNPSEQIVGAFSGLSLSGYQSNNERKKDMTSLPPLTGPKGISYSPFVKSMPFTNTYITKYCKEPELAFRLFDFAGYEPTMAAWSRFGVPGIDWDTKVEGLKGLYEDSLGVKCGFRQINNLWATPQNAHWYAVNPEIRLMTDPLSMQGSAMPNDPLDYRVATAKAVAFYKDKYPQEFIRIVYTPDEVSQINDTANSLTTYMQESSMRFITGDRPFSEWENYVRQLDKIGLQEYLKVQQIGYERGLK